MATARVRPVDDGGNGGGGGVEPPVPPVTPEPDVDPSTHEPSGRVTPLPDLSGGIPGKGGVGGPDTGGPGKGAGGTPSSETPTIWGDPMLPDPHEGGGFADPNVRPVAGINPWMDWAAGNLPGMMGPTGLETEAAGMLRGAVGGAGRTPTGAGLPGGAEGTNASFEATRRAFEAMTIPQIRQSRTMMGLGDSNAVTNDISRAWAGVLPTLVENELGREERGIQRETGAGFSGAQGLGALSGQQTGREFGATDRGFGFGTGFREVAEEGNRAIYEDFIRRQGLAERLLFAPFGQAGSSIGSRTDQGGWFK